MMCKVKLFFFIKNKLEAHAQSSLTNATVQSSVHAQNEL